MSFQIRSKDGTKTYEYSWMKQYTIDRMEQKINLKDNKHSDFVKYYKQTNKSIPELIDLVEKEFGEDGVIFLFLHEFDFSDIDINGLDEKTIRDKIYNLIKKQKKLEQSGFNCSSFRMEELEDIDLTLWDKIKFFFVDFLFQLRYNIKNGFLNTINFFRYPFKNLLHRKKYYLSKKISENFCLYFLIIIIRNLEYYKNNFNKIFKNECTLSESEENEIQKHIDYQYQYLTISEQLNSFDYTKDLDLFRGMSEESFKEVQNKILKVRNIKFEKNSKLIEFIQEKMYF